MVHWFAKSLEGCLKGETKGFYTTVREGNRSFIVQWCSNARGCYMVLVEYGGVSKHSFIFIPEEEG